MQILRNFFLAGGAALLASTPAAAEDTEHIIQYHGKSCIELKDFNGWYVWASRPGDYCVAQDLYQSEPAAWFRLPHQPVPKGPMVSVNYASNVTIDLMTHHLSAKIPYGLGIYLNDGSFWPNGGGKAPPYHTIKISNGTVTTSKQPTVVMVHAWDKKNKRFYHQSLGDNVRSNAPALADYHGDIEEYAATEYVLENLTLESDNVAVIMQGKKNVIRHCKIIGGNGTVNLYGPNLTFEDNDIILNAKDPQKAGDEPAVALYLEDAADSVVRNNRITIKGHAAKADAIVLKNSANVLLEGNTITGTKEVYKLLDERSSVKAAGNTAK